MTIIKCKNCDRAISAGNIPEWNAQSNRAVSSLLSSRFGLCQKCFNNPKIENGKMGKVSPSQKTDSEDKGK